MTSLKTKTKVLVVEDEPTQRRQLKLRLEEQNYEVLEAQDGWEGSQLFLKNPDLRLVITDLVMPEMDGFQFIEFLREMETQYIYIIVLTILEDKDSIIKALTMGADDYICKPVFKEELILRLEGAKRLLKLESQNELIFSMARLASYSSGESGQHLYRVRAYCLILALDLMKNHPSLGLTRYLCQEIADVSPLHDIGRMLIPDALLGKEAQSSTAPQPDNAGRHAVVGGNIIKEIFDKTGAMHLKLAYEIVMFHHERWDGSGYPEGLVGEKIPLVARILALADAFDQLVTQQRTKKLLPYDEIRKVLISESGRQFDPMVVEAFLRQEGKMLQVLEKYEEDDQMQRLVGTY